jgi:hypothetical protein
MEKNIGIRLAVVSVMAGWPGAPDPVFQWLATGDPALGEAARKAAYADWPSSDGLVCERCVRNAVAMSLTEATNLPDQIRQTREYLDQFPPYGRMVEGPPDEEDGRPTLVAAGLDWEPFAA